MKQLILGGARSGKSALAEQLAKTSGKSVIYIATANAVHNDGEMHSRIQHHQQRRPSEWQTVETPLLLAQQLEKLASPDHCLLIDCLTLWLTNCLIEQDIDTWPKERKALLDCLENLPGNIIMVSNEVGSGIVPLGELNRRFVDECGFLHQSVASICDRVILTAAGLPLIMKGSPLPATGER
jgi:adenosylcobinamide kinase/adenosylcobinamide-phosphate guanylyltransferase